MIPRPQQLCEDGSAPDRPADARRLSALAVLGGVALLVAAPPLKAALSDPVVYGLVLLGAAAGLLVAPAALTAADSLQADDGERRTPTGAGSGFENRAPADLDPEGALGATGAVPTSTAGSRGEVTTEQRAESIDSVQELFEQVADEEPAESLLNEDAVEESSGSAETATGSRLRQRGL